MPLPNQNPFDIKLYAYPTSPFAMKVACYLAYKQLPYQYIAVNPLTSKQIAFTQQSQIAVLQIGAEWRLESTAQGVWLEEQFPEHPILGEHQQQRQQILAMADWVDNSLIPMRFREVVQWPSWSTAIHNGWLLARAVHTDTPLSMSVRLLWPFLIRKAPFVSAMMREVDFNETLEAMRARLITEFLYHLDGGAFMGRLKSPSLADLSAYPVIVFNDRLGFQDQQSWLDNPAIMAWCQRLQKHLPPNPFLAAKQLLKPTT